MNLRKQENCKSRLAELRLRGKLFEGGGSVQAFAKVVINRCIRFLNLVAIFCKTFPRLLKSLRNYWNLRYCTLKYAFVKFLLILFFMNLLSRRQSFKFQRLRYFYFFGHLYILIHLGIHISSGPPFLRFKTFLSSPSNILDEKQIFNNQKLYKIFWNLRLANEVHLLFFLNMGGGILHSLNIPFFFKGVVKENGCVFGFIFINGRKS